MKPPGRQYGHTQPAGWARAVTTPIAALLMFVGVSAALSDNAMAAFNISSPATQKYGSIVLNSYLYSDNQNVDLAVGTITWSEGGTTLCSVASGGSPGPYTLTCSPTLSIGSHTIDGVWSGGDTSQTTFTVIQGDQTVSFQSTAPSNATAGGSYTPRATATSGLTAAITVDGGSSSVCSISGGVVSFAAAGTCTLNANQVGNTNYNAATQVQQSVTVAAPIAQTIAFTSTAPSPATVGGATYTVTATGGASGNAVTFALDAASTGCSISSAAVSFTAVGTCIINANQAGNVGYIAAPGQQQSFPVAEPVVTSVSASPINSVYGAGLTITATLNQPGSGTLQFRTGGFSMIADVRFTNTNTVSFVWNTPPISTGFGLRAILLSTSQGVVASLGIVVTKIPQAIAFTSSAPTPVVGGTYAVSATGGASGNPVSFSIDAASTSGACTIANNTVTFAAAGTCIVDADQAGTNQTGTAPNWSAAYLAASRQQQTITVNRANQSTLTIASNPSSLTFGGGTATLSPSGGNGTGLVSYNVTSGPCTVNATVLTATGVGSCSVTGTKPADTNYNAQTSAAISVAVGQATQTIAFAPPANQTYTLAGTLTLSATGGASGLPVTFASTSAAICTTGGTNGATVTFVSAGACAITASQAGNTNYAAATDVPKSFSIGQASQAISFTPPSAQTFTPSGTVTLSATGGASGNAVTFASTSTAICTTGGTNGATVTFVSAGACTITASQAGNTNYAAATGVARSFSIGQALQTISFTAPAAQTFTPGGTVTLSAT